MDWERQGSHQPAVLPWRDRPDPRPAAGSTRSPRDLEILRALAHRIPAGDAGAHNNLGVVYFQKGMLAEAVTQFEQALHIDPALQVAERNLQIAYFTGDFYDTAVRALHSRLAENPGDSGARRRLARMFLWGGDAAAALRELHLLRGSLPDDAGLWHEIARAEDRTGDLDAALRALAQADRTAPGNTRTALRIAEVLLRNGHHADARARLEAIIESDDTNAEAHRLLARVLDALGETDAARREAGWAAALNPAFDRADTGLALDAEEEREATAARQLGVAESGTLARYNVGIALRQNGRYEEAEAEFERALLQGEDAFLVRQAIAELRLLRGDEEAAAAYVELLEVEPASPKLWNELGVTHHLNGRLAEAEDAYSRALALDAGYALSWNNLAVVRHDRREGDAGVAFESALHTGRALAEVWRNLGWLRHRGGRVREAEHAYRRALDADPGSARAWTGLGMLFLESGQTDSARAALARAVEADPELAEARYHLAFALSAAGDYHGALRETGRALELSPYLTTPRFRLLVELQFEDAAVSAPDLGGETRVTAGEGVDRFEFEPDLLEVLLQPDGGPRAAADAPVQEAAERMATASAPSSIEWLAAARASLLSGNFAQAMSDVQRAGALGANPIEVRLLQGEIFLAGGAAGEAVERFASVLTDVQRVTDPAGAGLDARDLASRALAGSVRANLDLDRADQARQHAEHLYAFAPDEPDAAELLAEALESAGDPARAASIIEAALERAPGQVGLLARLGMAYFQMGDAAAAEPVLRQVADAAGGMPAARAVLGRLLTAQNRFHEAEAQFRLALEAVPSYGDAAVGLADLFAETARFDDAVDVLAMFLDADPFHKGALVRLGDVLWQAGRQEEASYAYRRVLRFEPGHEAALDALERLEPARSAAPREWEA